MDCKKGGLVIQMHNEVSDPSSNNIGLRIYQIAFEDRRGEYTPFVVSVDGLLHRGKPFYEAHSC